MKNLHDGTPSRLAGSRAESTRIEPLDEPALRLLASLLATAYLRLLASRSDTADRLAAAVLPENPLDSPDGQRQELAMSTRRRTSRG